MELCREKQRRLQYHKRWLKILISGVDSWMAMDQLERTEAMPTFNLMELLP